MTDHIRHVVATVAVWVIVAARSFIARFIP